MSLDIAIEHLLGTGWSSLDTSEHIYSPEGRLYPTVERIRAEFHRLGRTLELRRIDLFDCWRAEWTDASGTPAGAVVGQTEDEAAVHALAELRRLSTTGAPLRA